MKNTFHKLYVILLYDKNSSQCRIRVVNALTIKKRIVAYFTYIMLAGIFCKNMIFPIFPTMWFLRLDLSQRKTIIFIVDVMGKFYRFFTFLWFFFFFFIEMHLRLRVWVMRIIYSRKSSIKIDRTKIDVLRAKISAYSKINYHLLLKKFMR